MLKIKINNFDKLNLIAELADEFLEPDLYSFTEDEADVEINAAGTGSLDDIKRELYAFLRAYTGKAPEWGILTGVRPVKLAGELTERNNSSAEAAGILKEKYLISENKADMITDMYSYQKKLCGEANPNSAGIYIGIPFCPTRCLYCSFASNQASDDDIARYLEALKKEIAFTGEGMKRSGIIPETLYIGGGTPTSLNAKQLDALISTAKTHMDFSALKEFSVEAGRPDTISVDKLQVLKDHGVDRISINPQSMKMKTLEIIGRSHTPKDIVTAFEMAEKFRFNSINADLIAGLPQEDLSDFTGSLEKVKELGADNITVHSLAVKRASKLIEQDPDFHYKRGSATIRMTDEAYENLISSGFKPYYLYRQKHMAGAGENIGYCLDDKACIYNIRIMDEHQSIIALGAGGISKAYYPSENRLERVPNVTNFMQYIERIDEMLDRKEKNIFSKGVM